tara:strand:+ start:5200 stop:5718 length:519 start_codon:yes stop_codon:yes gene_type:complete
MKHYILRHFSTIQNKDIKPSLWELSSAGKEDSKIFTKKFNKNIKEIYSSPERKALYTAQQISKKMKIEVKRINYLQEIHRPKFMENYEEELSLFFAKHKDRNNNWEDYDQIDKRFKLFREEIKNKKHSILIISHGIFISLLLKNKIKQNPFKIWKSLSFGKIYEFEYDELFI